MAHLELLAEMDSLADELERWVGLGPNWPPARTCGAVIRRLNERTEAMRLRLEAPLVVATLGGTGTGKSALVNALVGDDVTETGRSRPTTRRPRLVTRPDLTPEALGIDPRTVEWVARDLPALANLVLIDCPDPDTTELAEAQGTNLARLRRLLPHCDVLLITATQQKYRSARVADELAQAASGARLVFVQTHSDVDEDVREDWRRVLEERYTTAHVFLVDSLAALDDAQNGLAPRGEFAGLVDLLTGQLAGTAAVRIRRANYLDLVAEALAVCRGRIDDGMPPVQNLEEAIGQKRAHLAAQLAGQMRTELLTSRRQWEGRLVGKVASRWGFSPFALVLRVFQGLGGLISGSLLYRARTPAQMALWGALQGARAWQKRRRSRRADQSAGRALASCWAEAELREAVVVLDGYAAEAELDRDAASLGNVAEEAREAGQAFAESVSGELESLLDRLAGRHSGWFTRLRYELLLAAAVVFFMGRLAKNFFYDTWLDPSVEIAGLDAYLISAFWLVLWCCLLLWGFTSRLRRGLKQQINQLASGWNTPMPAEGIFARLESECGGVKQFRHELQRLEQQVAAIRGRLALPHTQLGQRR
ncbi:MAG: GTPase domain-containing protein [Planctomycetota bacterium]|jgi:GTPase SAR1 family protein